MDQDYESELIREGRRLRGSRRAASTSTLTWLRVRAAAGPPGPAQRAAFVSLYREYYPEVRGALERFGASSDAAAEVAQQFFYKLFSESQRLSRLDPALGSLRAWLKRSVQSDYLNYKRKNDKFVMMGSEFDDWRISSELLPRSGSADPARLLQLARQQFIVRRAYRALQRKHTKPLQVALLRELDPDLSGDASKTTDAELAAAFGTTEENVRQRRYRIRVAFKSCIEKELRRWFPRSDLDPT